LKNNKQIIERIKILIKEIDKIPFHGIDIPEPLKEIGKDIGAEE
jgi:Txe/YoeB family toxin of Txe-Axe toxin-antitoxin module